MINSLIAIGSVSLVIVHQWTVPYGGRQQKYYPLGVVACPLVKCSL